MDVYEGSEESGEKVVDLIGPLAIGHIGMAVLGETMVGYEVVGESSIKINQITMGKGETVLVGGVDDDLRPENIPQVVGKVVKDKQYDNALVVYGRSQTVYVRDLSYLGRKVAVGEILTQRDL